jgi:hypothetical protein
LLGDGIVGGWKLVPVEAERTDPHLAPKVNLTVGIEDGSTGLSGTRNRLIVDGRKGTSQGLFERSKRDSERKDNLGCFNSSSRPDIPVESKSIHILC